MPELRHANTIPRNAWTVIKKFKLFFRIILDFWPVTSPIESGPKFRAKRRYNCFIISHVDPVCAKINFLDSRRKKSKKVYPSVTRLMIYEWFVNNLFNIYQLFINYLYESCMILYDFYIMFICFSYEVLYLVALGYTSLFFFDGSPENWFWHKQGRHKR